MSLNVNEEKNIFEKHKPDLGGSGLLDGRAMNTGSEDTPNIARHPNLCNREKAVGIINFISISRDLCNHPSYNSAPPSYRIVLLEILFRAAWQPTLMDHKGTLFQIEAGQLWISIRKLTDFCGNGIDKNAVERAISKFSLVGFLRHEVRHSKLLITITMPDLWSNKKDLHETDGETKVRHFRDTKEELKNKRIRESSLRSDSCIAPNVALSPTAAQRRKAERKIDPLRFNSQSGEFEGISEKDRSDWKIAYPSISVDRELAQSVQWIKSNPSKGNKTLWRKFLSGWFSKANERAENRAAYSSQNKFVDAITSNREYVLKKFKHGGIYRGAECFITADSVSFCRGLHLRGELKFKENGFVPQFGNLLNKFGISYDNPV